MHVRMHLIGSVDITRPRHGDGMVVAGAALGGGQIIPAIALEEMRALDEAERAAGEDVLDRPLQRLCRRIPFLQQDAVEGRRFRRAAIAFGAVVPLHVDEPLAAVIVVEERGIEAGGIDIDRLGPFGLDRGCRDDVVRRVLEIAVVALDVGIDQPELPVGIGQARRPDAAAIGIAAHVELRSALQRPAHQRPVHQVARMVDLHAGIPFEGRGGDVIIRADAADRRIGVEPRQNGIADHDRVSSDRRCFLLYVHQIIAEKGPEDLPPGLT